MSMMTEDGRWTLPEEEEEEYCITCTMYKESVK
jgi:hypothetical protein